MFDIYDLDTVAAILKKICVAENIFSEDPPTFQNKNYQYSIISGYWFTYFSNCWVLFKLCDNLKKYTTLYYKLVTKLIILITYYFKV